LPILILRRGENEPADFEQLVGPGFAGANQINAYFRLPLCPWAAASTIWYKYAGSGVKDDQEFFSSEPI
jgi:hypothetical protein